MVIEMTRESFLEYGEKFENKYFKKDDKDSARIAYDKFDALLKRFGFRLYESFNNRMRISSSEKKENTSWFYRLDLDEKGYEYIEVQVGWREEYKEKTYWKTVRGKNKKDVYRNLYAIRGIFRVHNKKVSLNPATGEPWKLGDVCYHESGCYSTILTKNGWWSGD